MTLTTEQSDVLRHATGHGSEQRNHYVDSPDSPLLATLVDLGLMNRSKPVAWMGGDCVYRVTDAGLAWLKEHAS